MYTIYTKTKFTAFIDASSGFGRGMAAGGDDVRPYPISTCKKNSKMHNILLLNLWLGL